MSELSDLYQEVILDHNRRPHNFRVIDPASATQEGYNPLCGDRLTLYLKVAGRRHRRHGVPGLRLRHLEGVGVADDRCGEGQDRRAGARAVRAFHQMITSRARQPPARTWASWPCWLGRPRVPDAREVRGPRLAHVEGGGVGAAGRPGQHRVSGAPGLRPAAHAHHVQCRGFLPMMPIGGDDAQPTRPPTINRSRSADIVPDP